MAPLTGPLAEALARGRAAYNAKFAAAQAAGGRIDPDAFLAHLALTVDPMVRGVAAVFAEKTDTVAAALYDLSLELFAAGLLGPQARCPAIGAAWRGLLPRVPKLLAREPQRVAGGVSNAVHHLAATPGARPQWWIEQMAALAGDCAAALALLEVGKVLAWRAGMAQYRAGALAVARQMEPRLTARALGLPADLAPGAVAAALDALAANPWLPPTAAATAAAPLALRLVRRAAGFRGFGGPFLAPPRVWSTGNVLLATDGEVTGELCADWHNALFIRTDVAAQPPGRAHATVSRDGVVRWGPDTTRFPELTGSTSWAANAHTLAVTLADSHYIFLIGRVPGGGPA